MAKRISIINFKGGVGKTALALHLATGLSSFNHKKRVLLIDVDHQSSLSFVILGGKEWEKVVDDGKTIDAVFQHFTNQDVKLPGKEIIFKQPYGKNYPNYYPNLDLVPATLQLDETELDLTSTNIGKPIQSEWSKRALICKWIEKNNIDRDYDYIIFDCPPATKIVTQNAILVSHGYIIPVIPDVVSTRGVPHLIDRVLKKIDGRYSFLADFLAVKKIEGIYVPSTELVGIVISKIKTHPTARSGYQTDQTIHLYKIKNDYSEHIITPYIVDGAGVPDSLSRGGPVYSFPNWQNVRDRGFVRIFEKITDELRTRIDKL